MDNIKFLLLLRATEVCRLILFGGRITLGLYVIPLDTENFWLCMQLWLVFLSTVWAYVSSRCWLNSSNVNDRTWPEILQCHVKPCYLQLESIKIPETFCEKECLNVSIRCDPFNWYFALNFLGAFVKLRRTTRLWVLRPSVRPSFRMELLGTH